MRSLSVLLVACAATLCSFAALADDEPLAAPRRTARQLFKPDAFATLVNPNCSHCVDEAKRRAAELRADDRVLAWIRGKYEGGAIPMRFFLVPYRVISDTYGVFVFDADAGFVRGFEPSLEFRFHGWRNGVMVIRHQDGTLFSTLSGIAFSGPRRGERLKPIATLETDWGFWNAAYPGSVAYHMFDKYQPRELPQIGNADSAKTRLEADPRGLDGQTRVVGLSLGDSAKAWPLTALEAAGGVIEDELDGQKIVVLWYAPTRTAAVYARQIEGEEPAPAAVSLVYDGASKRAPFRDRETGSTWGVEGRAIEGPLTGRTLRWLPGVQCRWYAWAAEYPDTQLHASPSKKQAVDGTSQSLERRPAPTTEAARPLEAVLVDVDGVNAADLAAWRRQGFRAAAVVLDERHDSAAYKRVARMLANAKLDLYYWIEVARQPEMAAAHPDWMASLGTHDDWRTRFPDLPAPTEGEVAKAFPWVPLAYRNAYRAHVARVDDLLKRAAGDYRGLLLNDLQGGPASCGCGNLQCRWAIDYGVPSTTMKLEGDDVAARFVADVQKLAPGKLVVPVWLTECEDRDLPADQAGGGRTGYCGGVACSRNTCPKSFTKQWSALVGVVDGPLGLIATHQELGREGPDYGEPAAWTTQPIDYLDTVLPANGGKVVAHDRLWLVVQGYGMPAEAVAAAREAAIQAGVGAVVVALNRVDQTYEPRIQPVK